MSSIGTGIAAGVAQTAQQSQSVSRSADKRRAEAARQQEETNDRVDQLLKAGETADADAELPDHQSAGYEQLYDEHGRPTGDGHEQDAEASPDSGADEDDDRPLYDHVDVKA